MAKLQGFLYLVYNRSGAKHHTKDFFLLSVKLCFQFHILILHNTYQDRLNLPSKHLFWHVRGWINLVSHSRTCPHFIRLESSGLKCLLTNICVIHYSWSVMKSRQTLTLGWGGLHYWLFPRLSNRWDSLWVQMRKINLFFHQTWAIFFITYHFTSICDVYMV